MRLTRLENSFDCCEQLAKELTKDNTEICQSRKEQRSDKLQKKTTWTTDRTMVCLGLEDRLEHNVLSSTYNHVFFINREAPPDTYPLRDTQKTCQIQSTLNFNSFIVSDLSCSCPRCRINLSDVENCLCKEHRNIEHRPMRLRSDNDDENSDDIGNLTIPQLKDICALHGLPRSGVKSVLTTRITTHLSAMSPATVNEEEAIFEMESET